MNNRIFSFLFCDSSQRRRKITEITNFSFANLPPLTSLQRDARLPCGKYAGDIIPKKKKRVALAYRYIGKAEVGKNPPLPKIV